MKSVRLSYILRENAIVKDVLKNISLCVSEVLGIQNFPLIKGGFDAIITSERKRVPDEL